MISRPWYICFVALVCLICTLPLGVTAQESVSWDSYESTWVQFNYYNLTKIEIYHPIDGSLVAEGQKLNFIVVPFDADELLYSVQVYKNDILMYTCNDERVYDVSIYMTNPINQVVTVTFVLNSDEILTLEYITILTSPSLDRDFTDQWLEYQREKGNESLTGREVVNIRDKAMSDINLVATTGGLCILFTAIAGLIVIIFKLISMMNGFTAIIMFVSSFFWLDSMRKVDDAMRTIPIATATDVSVYYSSLVILTLIFMFAMISYVVGYKIAKTRLREWEFRGWDVKNRTETVYKTVIHKERGKYYWMLQNSWDAFKRVFFKVKHEVLFDTGDMTDTFHRVQAKNIPENNDNKREFRELNRIFKSYYSKMAFITIPLPDKESKDEDDNTDPEETKPVKKRKLFRKKNKESQKESEKEDDEQSNIEQADRRFNFEVWTTNEDNLFLKQDTPITILKGNPDPIKIYNPDDYKTLDQQMKEIMDSAEKGIAEEKVEEMEKAWKQLKLFKKKKIKPIAYGMHIQLANANNYDLLHYQKEMDYLDYLSDKYKKKDERVHQLEMEMEVKTTEKAREKYEERDRHLKELQERRNIQEGVGPQ